MIGIDLFWGVHFVQIKRILNFIQRTETELTKEIEKMTNDVHFNMLDNYW